MKKLKDIQRRIKDTKKSIKSKEEFISGHRDILNRYKEELKMLEGEEAQIKFKILEDQRPELVEQIFKNLDEF